MVPEMISLQQSRTEQFGWLASSAIGLSLAAYLLVGCSSSQARPTNDQKVAAEAAEFVQAELASLPDSHPVVKRYGKFVSLHLKSVQRRRPDEPVIGTEGGGFPACLELELDGAFERFPTTIRVLVLQGEAESTLTLELVGEFLLDPRPEAVATSLADSEPTMRSDGLWLVKPDGTQTRCTLSCWVRHPDFDR